MPEYARVENGAVVEERLPKSGQLADGRTVSNYDALPEDVLREEGWLPVVDPGRPQYNPDTHRVVASWDVQGDRQRVVRSYRIDALPAPAAGLRDAQMAEDRLAELYAKLPNLTAAEEAEVPRLTLRVLGGRRQASVAEGGIGGGRPV